MADSVKPSDIDIFLSDAAWAVRSTHHTVLKASPGAAIYWRLTMAGLTDNNQPNAAEEEMARTTTTTSKDGDDNGRGRR
jgi:hypothetical protein